MVRIAIPIFHNRVSPVLDSCNRMMMVDVEDGCETTRRELFMENFALFERIDLIKKTKISVIICCGVSEVFDGMLTTAGIQLFCGIVGGVDEVLAAFLGQRLQDPRFHLSALKDNG